jgi:hypothetical protein
MPVEYDVVKKVRLVASDINVPVWLKGSDPPLGVSDVLFKDTIYYIDALNDFMPLRTTDPAQKLEPSMGTQTTETTRFTRYIVLTGTPAARAHYVFVQILGTGHIGVSTAWGATYYYRMYAKLAKTADFATFTDLTAETTIMSYSRGPAATTSWLDEGAINGMIAALCTLNAGETLLLVLRGTSWCSVASSNSIGINTTNLLVRAFVVA